MPLEYLRARMAEEGNQEDLFTILIATDNHIGYNEKDPIRGQDSMVSFEEIMKLAEDKKVDCILQGGDLFHDNKPSRQTVHKTMEVLRRYCMGDKPVTFQVVSEQASNFKHCSFPVVNYEDPNYNISIPVFMIHGNHDDPVGDGNLSAVDLLSVANLVNYFGKSDSVEDVVVSPVLLAKGATKIALFGVGNVRDERLHRAWKSEKVKFLRPRESQDQWFNILVLHQNRARHGLRNYIPEEFIPSFFDLVVWGHEHECRVEPEYRQFGVEEEVGFYITQPGSSVATSLADGEAKPKHVALLQVKGTDFKIEPIKLKTVRPFLFDTIVLADSGLDPLEADAVRTYIDDKVQDLIDRGNAESSKEPETPKPPLVRMKVDYSDGYEPINVARFGRQFSGQVANPNNILQFFHKKVEPRAGEGRQSGSKSSADERGSSLSKTKDNSNIQMFLYELLSGSTLELLSAKALVESLKEYVEKGEKSAIEQVVASSVKVAQEEMKKIPLSDLSDDIRAEFRRSRDELLARQEEEGEITIQRLAEERRLNPGKRPAQPLHSDDDDDNEDEVSAPTASRGGRGGRGRGSRAQKQGTSSTSATAAAGSSTTTRGKGRGRGRGRGSKTTTTTATATASSSLSSRQGKQSQLEFSTSGASPSSRSLLSSAIKARASKKSAFDYEDSEEEDENVWKSMGKKKQKVPSSAAVVDLTQNQHPSEEEGSLSDSNPFSAFSSRRKKK